MEPILLRFILKVRSYILLLILNQKQNENATIDKIYKELGASPKSATEIAAAFATVDAELIKDAVTLPVFQHPSANGVNAKLQGVAPSPFSPNLVWNVWDWYFTN